MPELEALTSSSHGSTPERSQKDVLEAARPLPLDGEMVIQELSDDEERLFLAVVFDQ